MSAYRIESSKLKEFGCPIPKELRMRPLRYSSIVLPFKPSKVSIIIIASNIPRHLKSKYIKLSSLILMKAKTRKGSLISVRLFAVTPVISVNARKNVNDKICVNEYVCLTDMLFKMKDNISKKMERTSIIDSIILSHDMSLYISEKTIRP